MIESLVLLASWLAACITTALAQIVCFICINTQECEHCQRKISNLIDLANAHPLPFYPKPSVQLDILLYFLFINCTSTQMCELTIVRSINTKDQSKIKTIKTIQNQSLSISSPYPSTEKQVYSSLFSSSYLKGRYSFPTI